MSKRILPCRDVVASVDPSGARLQRLARGRGGAVRGRAGQRLPGRTQQRQRV